MTDRPLRTTVLLLVALVALTGGAYVAHQRLYASPQVRDLTPPPGELEAAPPDPPAAAVSGTAQADVPRVDPAWLARVAGVTGIEPFALEAYARAELAAPDGCGVGWTTLAGIGWVESQHGTIGGRTLGADGRSSSRILGPALDGSGAFAAIPATAASTQWHADPLWDHAVGPMQFIPTTWETWQVDGDNDGVRDPNDLDDAALAAAEYLCAGGRDLTSGAGWTEAVLSYNNARVYAVDVHAAATQYAAGADS
ncbi:lytic transglycosylase domain-containing protein [Nocardioides dongxiaopingii]|uniref:lytic murein transglycosylase n=1 Tax=Nocardioides TaxID=1839 RepID=UPI0010C76679|nr:MULTISPECIES: lytic murein transglycosylase [Nocardioides]QCW49411.1 lytic transglycosylase domain-containing protein [Nocardioides sp. S-1144]